MRISALATIAAASAVIVLAGCSGNGSSAISPLPGSGNSARTNHSMMTRSTSVLPPALQGRVVAHASNPNMSRNSCPSTGELIYASDYGLGVVNIYNSSLTLCGQLTGFSGPQGMSVHNGDLLVANTNTSQVMRFHRGATAPWKTYNDTNEFPVDAIVMNDGTVVVSNIIDTSGNPGSISTFKGGGAFVGTFTPPNLFESFFITSFRTTIFEDGFDSTNFVSAFWSMNCPHGACTNMTDLGEAMSFPGGMATSRSGDEIASDQIGNTADTFEMPSLAAVTFNWNTGGDTDGIATDHDITISHVYGADALNNLLNCYNYKQSGHSPSSCGSVAGNSGGELIGVAVDPGT